MRKNSNKRKNWNVPICSIEKQDHYGFPLEIGKKLSQAHFSAFLRGTTT